MVQQLHGTRNFSFLVTHNEINERHGVAILIRNIFSQGNGMLTIRSTNDYDGHQTFGDVNLHINHKGLSRSKIMNSVQTALNGMVPDRILSIPYYRDDVLSSLAIKNLFGVPMCTYIMDDQNIAVNNIPDDDIRELLERSDLCLGISREMCRSYEEKYRKQFWFVPPLVESTLIADRANLPQPHYLESRRGVLIGNVWSQKWLDCLRAAISASGASLDWFGNPDRRWLNFEEQVLAHEHICFKGYRPPSVLADLMKQYPFAIVPTGSSEGSEDRPELTKLSLPSRIPFIMATSNTPIIVMGSPDSAAAKFVTRFEIGLVCDYEAGSFTRAVDRICSPTEQRRMRRSAFELAQFLSADGVDQWIWSSLERQRPSDFRFEKLQ